MNDVKKMENSNLFFIDIFLLLVLFFLEIFDVIPLFMGVMLIVLLYLNAIRKLINHLYEMKRSQYISILFVVVDTILFVINGLGVSLLGLLVYNVLFFGAYFYFIFQDEKYKTVKFITIMLLMKIILILVFIIFGVSSGN